MIGVTGSTAGPDSPASCYLIKLGSDEIEACQDAGEIPGDVEVRDWNVVVELGNGSMGPLVRYVPAHLIDGLLISHTHPDHFADISSLYVYLKYHPIFGTKVTGDERRLPVWGPSDISQRIQHLTADLKPRDDTFSQFPMQSGMSFWIGPLQIEVLEMFHVVETIGFRITGPSSVFPGTTRTLTYTGDTDYCENLVVLARDADLLLAEASFVEGRDASAPSGMHLTGRQAGKVARESGAKRLVLTHIPPWNDPQVTLAEASSEYSGPITLAIAGAEIEL
jgi:ribonuclease BN (tRNA processing enzyme)